MDATQAIDSATIRKAWRFFLEHAGYCTPPGRAACALSLARAEHAIQWLEYDDRAEFEWRYDEDADLSWMDEDERKLEHEVLGCVLKVDGEHVASLWGIVDADSSYRRVVQAELASEYLEVVANQRVNTTRGALAINALSL